MNGAKGIGTGPDPAQFGKMAIGGIPAEAGNGYPDIGEMSNQTFLINTPECKKRPLSRFLHVNFLTRAHYRHAAIFLPLLLNLSDV